MLTCGQVHDFDIAIGKSRMMDAVKVSLQLLEICLPGNGIDFHRCQFMAKKGGAVSLLYASFQGQHILIELLQVLIGHIHDRLIHERIQVNVLRCHENHALNGFNIVNITGE
jgi:hypothetical protein